MTIDEAITHAREVAEKERKSKCNTYDINDCYECEKYKEISTSKRMTEIICPCGNKTFEYIPSENKNVRVDKNDCLQCAEQHEQLAEWLEELKDYRDKNKMVCKVDVMNMDELLEKVKEAYQQGRADAIEEIEKRDNRSFLTTDEVHYLCTESMIKGREDAINDVIKKLAESEDTILSDKQYYTLMELKEKNNDNN